jgi:hypothetical protein
VRFVFFPAALLCAAAAAATPPSGAPIAEATPAQRDLGSVPADDVVTTDFAVANRGGAPLTLEALLAPGTRVTVEPGTVPPGGSAVVKIEIGTANREGASTVAVELRTNDPAHAILRLPVSLKVRAVVLADPGFARYNFVEGGRPGIIRETVFAADDASFRVLGVDSPYPSLSARWRPAAPTERLPERSGAQWVVDLTLSPYAPVGPLAAEVVVRVDHPKQRQVMIPVTGFVRPMLAVTPPEADLGDLEAEPVTARLHVKNFGEDPVTLSSATCEIPGSTVEIRPIEPGRVWQVILRLPAGAPGSLVTGFLRLETTSSTQPEIEIPVRGRFRGK